MSATTLTKEMSQDVINAYAEASGDHNPIHVDEAFAKATPLGGTIAHGMLVLASVSEMMAASLGEDWLRHGKLRVRFRAPARSGTAITASSEQTESGAYAVEVRGQGGDVLVSGTAEIAG